MEVEGRYKFNFDHFVYMRLRMYFNLFISFLTTYLPSGFGDTGAPIDRTYEG